MSQLPMLEIRDPSFRQVVGPDPKLAPIATTAAHEGPVFDPATNSLFFTTEPDPAAPLGGIRRLVLAEDGLTVLSEESVASPAVLPNGMALGADGALVVCEQGDMERPARISRVDPITGSTSPIVSGWEGTPLNSPNDVFVDASGAVWFTDPSYGFVHGFRPRPSVGDFVYRHDPATAETEVVDDSFVKPNGIALSPDGRTLYVTDSGANQEPGSFYPHLPHHVVAFDVADGRRLDRRHLFAVTSPGFPDGIKTDDGGRVYVSSPTGVIVYEPDGRQIGRICVPGTVNFVFGGPERNILYVTNDQAVWAATLAVTGGPRKGRP